MALLILVGIIFSLVSLLGAGFLLLSREQFNKLIPLLVATAAGALLGGAFFHLIPETVAEIGNTKWAWAAIASSFLFFFALEQFLHWHHCHKLEHQPVGYMLLGAGALHSLIDGLALGAVFIVSPELGLLSFLVLLAHEVPQSLGDFGALVSSGWKPKKALFWNFVSSTPFTLGLLLAVLMSSQIDTIWLLPLAAGGFLYIGAADLLPQLRSDKPKEQLGQFLFVLLGLALLFFLQ